MEQVPSQINVSWGIVAIPVFVIFAFFVGGTLASLLSRTTPQARLKLSLLISAGFVALGVVLLFWCSMPQQYTLRAPQPPLSVVPKQMMSQPKIIEPESFTVTVPSHGDDAAVNESSLPEWTKLKSYVDGKRTLVVVKSGRFASLDEAERTALDEAVAAATQHFRDLDPRGIGDRFVTQLAPVEQTVKQRFEETTEHDFGKFKAPMHQVWLQIELTPEVGEQIALPWREAAVEARLRTLGLWGIGITVVAALVAFALRLDSVWNGRGRTGIVVATIALALGCLASLS